jgi:hypothetical protein
MYPNSSEGVQQDELQLQKFAEVVCAYWEPIKTWTPVALLLSQDANILAAATLVGLAFALSASYFLNFRRNTYKIAYSKISEEDKKVLLALSTTQRSTMSTVGNIAATYRKLNGQEIEETALASRLEGLARAGLAYQDVTNIVDNPVYQWKTNYRGIFNKTIEKL